MESVDKAEKEKWQQVATSNGVVLAGVDSADSAEMEELCVMLDVQGVAAKSRLRMFILDSKEQYQGKDKKRKSETLSSSAKDKSLKKDTPGPQDDGQWVQCTDEVKIFEKTKKQFTHQRSAVEKRRKRLGGSKSKSAPERKFSEAVKLRMQQQPNTLPPYPTNTSPWESNKPSQDTDENDTEISVFNDTVPFTAGSRNTSKSKGKTGRKEVGKASREEQFNEKSNDGSCVISLPPSINRLLHPTKSLFSKKGKSTHQYRLKKSTHHRLASGPLKVLPKEKTETWGDWDLDEMMRLQVEEEELEEEFYQYIKRRKEEEEEEEKK